MRFLRRLGRLPRPPAGMRRGFEETPTAGDLERARAQLARLAADRKTPVDRRAGNYPAQPNRLFDR